MAELVKKRDSIIDITRGLGIILVVMLHCNAPFSDFFFLFHMPLFFVISGYLFNCGKIKTFKDFWEYVIKKLRGLYIPFVICNLFFTIPALFKITSSGLVCKYDLQGFLFRIGKLLLFTGGSQLGGTTWFFRALFLALLIYAIITLILNNIKDDFFRNISRILFISICFLAGLFFSSKGINFDNIGSAFSVIILLESGRLYRKYVKDFQPDAGIAVAFLLLVFCYKFDLKPFIVLSNENINLFWIILTAMSGFVLTISLARILKKNFFTEKIFSYIGKHTRAIMCLHFASFKIVTLIQIIIFRLELSKISAFPTLITSGLFWILYTVAGICIPLILVLFFNIIKNNMLKFIKEKKC